MSSQRPASVPEESAESTSGSGAATAPDEATGDTTTGRAAGDASGEATAASRWLGVSLAAVGVAGGVGLADLFLRRFQRQQMFGPTRFPDGSWNPHRHGVPVESVFFESLDGVRLHGWWLPREEARGTLLFFHGSAGNLGGHVEALQALARLPVSLFAFDYRGYGRSDGAPSEEGLFLDGRAALRHVQEELGRPAEQVVLYGHSLGGAVAIETALHHPGGAGLVVQSSFTDVKGMARALFPSVPLHWVARNQFRSIHKVERLELPKLFVHGTADQKVPPEHTRALFGAASEPKDLYWVEGAEHGDVHQRGGLAYLQRLERFLDECLG